MSTKLELFLHAHPGKVRAIGVSNYTIRHLEEMMSYATLRPHVLQVCKYFNFPNSMKDFICTV